MPTFAATSTEPDDSGPRSGTGRSTCTSGLPFRYDAPTSSFSSASNEYVVADSLLSWSDPTNRALTVNTTGTGPTITVKVPSRYGTGGNSPPKPQENAVPWVNWPPISRCIPTAKDARSRRTGTPSTFRHFQSRWKYGNQVRPMVPDSWSAHPDPLATSKEASTVASAASARRRLCTDAPPSTW